MTEGPNVFISYSREDLELAQLITERVRNAGLSVSLDSYINPGDSIFVTLRNQIASSDYIILVISQDFINSEWGQSDLKYAIQKEMRQRSINIIPFKVGDFRLPEFFSSLSVVDASRNIEKGLEKLVSIIQSATKINFDELTYTSAEDFAVDFLKSFGFESIKKARHSSDFGFDFSAVYLDKDPFGRSKEIEWIIEVKALKSKKADISALSSFLGALSLKGENTRGLFMTFGQLTTPAVEWLEHMRRSGKPQIEVLEGPEIKKYTINKPRLVAKYFGKVGEE